MASSNVHKLLEFRALFDGTSIVPRSPAELGLPVLEVQELGKTFHENALTKAIAYQQAYRMPAIADDSGICVDALSGAPGIRSARFGSADFDDADRVLYLLRCLIDVPSARRGAHYVCALVLAAPGHDPLSSVGQWYGRVAAHPSTGTGGFGYDPVFLLPPFEKSVADLTSAQKNADSHRGRAVRSLLKRVEALD